VAQVLQALAENQRLNLLIAPGVEGVVSLHLQGIPVKQAFQLVLKTAELTQLREGNVLQIVPKARMQQQQAVQEERRKEQALKLPLLNQVFSPAHADADELAAALKAAGEKLLSLRGSITVDKRTNRLIVRDNKAALKQIAGWMEEMDLPMGQVEIAAHIVTVNQNKLHELGVKWNLAQGSRGGAAPDFTGSGADVSVNNATTHIGFNIARIDGRLLEMELSALE